MRAKANAPLEGVRINIEINGEAWTLVDSFKDSDPEDKHFVFDPHSGEILFGDGKKGRMPSSGSEITVRYQDGGRARGKVRRKRLRIIFCWDGRC